MWLYVRLFISALGLLGRHRQDLVLEVLVLRQQLAVYQRGKPPTRLRAADRRFWSVLARAGRDGASRWSWCSRRRSSAGIARRGAGTGGGRVVRARAVHDFPRRRGT